MNVMRTLEGAAACSCVSILARRGDDFGQSEQQMRRIVGNVRRDGDRALCRYAQRGWGSPKMRRSKLIRRDFQRMQQVSPEFGPRCGGQQQCPSIRHWQNRKRGIRTQNGISVGTSIRPLASVAATYLAEDIRCPQRCS